jgi:hydroxymethylglutaryl-CoA reductase
MPLSDPTLFNGFSKLSASTRFERLKKMGALTEEDCLFLNNGGIGSLQLAETFIENAIGYFQLPLGVATYFRIDDKDLCIPMAVEETSIIAALSKTAKWIRHQGAIKTNIIGDTHIGQLQIHTVKNPQKLADTIQQNKSELVALANSEVGAGLKNRGGGIKDISLRFIDEMAVIHVYVNCCDAMGANIINQILEYLKTPIEKLCGETIDICILSNLNDSKLTRAEVVIDEVTAELGERIERVSRFAECDPYRAATHNKGVMNGIDPILIVTGNDWRAVEAGVHAYACQQGQYRPVTTWRYNKGQLKGQFEAPITVGTVGGVTTLHPTAQLCLKMLGVKHADDLSRICAAVGLVQNLGALRALTTEGIIKGHMKLHIDNLVLATDATPIESAALKQKLVHLLNKQNRVSQTHANKILNEMRKMGASLPPMKCEQVVSEVV